MQAQRYLRQHGATIKLALGTQAEPFMADIRRFDYDSAIRHIESLASPGPH
jgi:hypothetical protein